MKTPLFLTAAWRNLVMLNYEIDPALLASRVPRGTELDSFDGRTFVSVVGFLFLDTRVLGVPIPLHRDFEELNLRFYVRREAEGEIRRGVVFVKEIVPRAAIAWVARTVYNENYVAMPMRHHVRLPVPGGDGRVEYSWDSGSRWNRVSARMAGPPEPIAPGSHEELVAEHYWGYAAQRDGGTVEYEVEHPPWRVWRALDPALDCDVSRLYGDEFLPALSTAPASAFVAEGSEIVVRQGRRMG
ncbi:MAG: DUF2071 domain-containing protein [Acidobacteria bacterium]|nr:DUF2071 domain-containing protein [Acidobacteriota bacterium]